jgi:hypothetical protein
MTVLPVPMRNPGYRCISKRGDMSNYMERMGFEPTTPWLQTRCSPS